MVTVNQNYLKLPGSYLFSNIAKKVSAYKEANPEFKDSVISLGIGDVTQPLAPAIIDALHKSVDEMAHAETFHGYAPDLGYEFLRSAIAKNDYQSRGCDISADEIFVSDGAKSDSGNIQEIFGLDNKVAVCDPVYPVYVDTNVMAGRTGLYNKERENFDGVIYMPCKEENGFLPEIPADEVPDLIYLCFPNNPTGGAITKAALQEWVDYANKNGCVIIYDAAYEAYISEEDVPHSIYECEGARTCAIELRSFSKNAGFTGVRLGFTVVPKELVRDGLIYEMQSVTVIEIMGRNAGWLTGAAVLAKSEDCEGPDLIYLPEVAFDVDDFLKKVKKLVSEKQSIVIAVSEGIKTADGRYVCELSAPSDKTDSFGHVQLSGTGKYLSDLIIEKLGCKSRAIELSTLQRCAGHLTSRVDITEAYQVGGTAVKAAFEGKTGQMVILKRVSQDPYICTTDLYDVHKVANLEKKVPRSWITEEGDYVTAEMKNYIEPLIQAELTPIMITGQPRHIIIDDL